MPPTRRPAHAEDDPAPPRRKRPRKDDVGGRERVLRAAVRLFAAKGYAATTVRDILRAAGVTAPVLYHHFGSKEGVFLDLANEGVRQLHAAHARALGLPGTAAERIRAYCRATVALKREYADLARIVETILSGPPEAVPRFDFGGLVTTLVRQLEGLVREGIEKGEFAARDPLPAALALLGVSDFAARPGPLAAAVLTAGDPLEDMLSVVLAGLASPSGPPRRRRLGRRPPKGKAPPPS